MIFEQYFLSCLSQASYLVGDETTGRAVVVDPRRDVSDYLTAAEQHGLHIEHVIETHVHADFVSGHLELAAATGADICFGRGATTEFPGRLLGDRERISLGEVSLEIRATPGHTPESICIVVYEHAGDMIPYGVLTGDTMFIGDVGRPDLLASKGATPMELASLLFHSLHEQLLTLPDDTRVYPAHGAGSACGKNLSTETWSTIGQQRRSNHALLLGSEGEFVASVTEGQPSAPPYFPYDSHLNCESRQLLDDHQAPPALSLSQVLELQGAGAVVLDTRDPPDFAAGHLRAAINVGLGGRFAELAGAVLDPADDIVLVCDPGHATEARVRLARIGFDKVAGVLEGDVQAAMEEVPELTDRQARMTVEELAVQLSGDRPGVVVLDVRGTGERAAGAIEGSIGVPLAELIRRIDEIPSDHPIVVHCASGYRSSIAASVLAHHGRRAVSDLVGGYEAWAVLEDGRAG